MNRNITPEARPTGLAWRIIWVLLMVSAAFAAIGLALDREARRRPDLSATVPGPFRHFAQFGIATQALLSGDDTRALAEAKRLIVIRPIPAEHLSLLAFAAQRKGLDELWNRAIMTSAGRGWREVSAQRVVAEAAMSAGDWTAAFHRVAALWSLGERGPDTVDELDRIARIPNGRTALAQWLRDSSTWRDKYATWGSANLDPDTYAAAIDLAISHKTKFACPTLADAAMQLLRRGAPLAADRVWAGSCRHGSLLTARSFAFVPAGRGDPDGPFGWTVSGVSAFDSAGGGSSPSWLIDYDNPRPGYAVIAQRFSGLKPGNYMLSVAVERSNGDPSLPLRLRAACVAREGGLSALADVRLDENAFALEIPESSCAAQRIEILAPRGSGSIAGIKLAPVGP